MPSLQELFNVIGKDKLLLKGYASNKCKECVGRGYKEVAIPRQAPQLYMCGCVANNIKKEFKNQ